MTWTWGRRWFSVSHAGRQGRGGRWWGVDRRRGVRRFTGGGVVVGGQGTGRGWWIGGGVVGGGEGDGEGVVDRGRGGG